MEKNEQRQGFSYRRASRFHYEISPHTSTRLAFAEQNTAYNLIAFATRLLTYLLTLQKKNKSAKFTFELSISSKVSASPVARSNGRKSTGRLPIEATVCLQTGSRVSVNRSLKRDTGMQQYQYVSNYVTKAINVNK